MSAHIWPPHYCGIMPVWRWHRDSLPPICTAVQLPQQDPSNSKVSVAISGAGCSSPDSDDSLLVQDRIPDLHWGGSGNERPWTAYSPLCLPIPGRPVEQHRGIRNRVTE